MKYQDELVNFLREIIAIPSMSTQETKVVERIMKEMENSSFDEVTVDKIGNIIGRIGNGPIKVLYDSHIDTVDIGNKEAWAFDPFIGKLENGIVYGRGASDNKAAIATMLYGAKLFKEKYSELLDKISLYVVGTVQEEDCDGLAMEYLIKETGINPDFVVLGECTNLDIYRGHRGRMELKISVYGKSSHASAPNRGVNAVTNMAPIIEAVHNLNSKLKDDQFLGKGTIVVSKIVCDTGSLNTVPDKCEIYLDRRLTNGETKDSSVKELEEIIKNIKVIDGQSINAEIEILHYDSKSHTGLDVSIEKYYPTWVLEEGHDLVKAGVETVQKVLGKPPKVDKWTFSTNGIASMGKLNIPTIGFGPSKEEYAHTTDDQVSVDHLNKAAAFYAEFPKELYKLVK